MAAEPEPARVFRFGSFEADLGNRQLFRNGISVNLTGQPFEVLALLLERRGQLVTREQLRARLWPSGTVVEFDHGITAALTRLREALHDDAQHPRFIATVPRHGYRFISQVSTAAQSMPGPSVRAVRESATRPAPAATSDVLPSAVQGTRWPWPTVLAVLAAVPVLIAGTAAYVSLPRAWQRFAEVSPAIHSLAVLPLENLSGDKEQEYFADGMTDELITELGQIHTLRVISRNSIVPYKGKHKSLAQIARDLNVDAVVEGTVFHSGSRVRITAQLIEVKTDRHLWARSYEGDLHNVLALQEEVATDITKQLSIELTPQERIVLNNAQSVSPEAHEAYLRGRYFWAKRGTADDIQEATRYFKQATQDDPQFAPAYAALAETYAVAPDYSSARPTESYDRAAIAADQALAIDAASVEAHVALALVAGNRDFDWQLSESEFRRALDLNPGYANAHHWHALDLMFLGRLDEALAEMEHARKLDPLSIIINANVGFVLYNARQWDRAVGAEQKSLELDPNSSVIHRYLGLALLQQGRFEEALSNLQKAVDLSGDYAEYAAELSYAYAAAGNRGRAQKILADLERRYHREYVPSFSLAVAYAGLGEKAAALARLQSAVDEHCDLIPTLKVNPLFDTLRSEPRFTELLRRIRLAT